MPSPSPSSPPSGSAGSQHACGFQPEALHLLPAGGAGHNDRRGRSCHRQDLPDPQHITSHSTPWVITPCQLLLWLSPWWILVSPLPVVQSQRCGADSPGYFICFPETVWAWIQLFLSVLYMRLESAAGPAQRLGTEGKLAWLCAGNKIHPLAPVSLKKWRVAWKLLGAKK